MADIFGFPLGPLLFEDITKIYLFDNKLLSTKILYIEIRAAGNKIERRSSLID